MANKTQYSVTIGNKKYVYSLIFVNKKVTRVECKDLNIDQEFLNEDIPALLLDLPNLIIAEKDYKKHQEEIIRFRISPEDKKLIEAKAIKNGYTNVSSFLRDLALSR